MIENNKNIIVVLLIIAGIIIFVVGAGLGIFYKTRKDSPQLEKSSATIKAVSSKLISSVLMYGQATKIDGRNITLSFGGDSAIVAVADNAQITKFVMQAVPSVANPKITAQTQVQQKIALKDIKVGDTLNISIKVLPDGQLQGQTVMILPSFNTPATPGPAVPATK